MRNEYGSGCRANGGDNPSGTVKLFNGFNQQRAVAKTLGALNAARQDDDVVVAVGDFNQRRIRQQFYAA